MTIMYISPFTSPVPQRDSLLEYSWEAILQSRHREHSKRALGLGVGVCKILNFFHVVLGLVIQPSKLAIFL